MDRAAAGGHSHIDAWRSAVERALHAASRGLRRARPCEKCAECSLNESSCAWSHRHATDCVARAQQPTTSILSAVRGSSLALRPLAHVWFPAWTVICTQERNMYQMLAASCGLRSSKIFFDEQAPLSQSAMCSFMLTECCVRSLCAHLYGILVSSNGRLRREHDLIRACAIFKPARCLTAIILTSGLIRSKWSRSSIIILLHRGFLHVCSSAPLWGMYSSWAAPHDSSPLSVMTNGNNMRRSLAVCLNFSRARLVTCIQ